jgi:cytochrome bd-type quinol oxidase subunit 2
LYGVKVAMIAITNSKKEIAKRAKYIYILIVVFLLLINIAMTCWMVKVKNNLSNQRLYVQLGNYIIMMIFSIIVAHRTWRLFKTIRQF